MNKQTTTYKKKLKDKKIEILVKTDGGENILGEPLPSTLEPIHDGKLWAYVRQLSANEFYKATQAQTGEEMLFIINWRDDFDSSAIIKYKNRYYDIKRIDTFEGYKQDLKVYADFGTDKSPIS